MGIYRYAILFMTLIFWGTQITHAQEKHRSEKIRVPAAVCYASDKVEKFYAPPPVGLLKSVNEKQSEIITSYSLFPEKAKQAFEYAVNIWEYYLQSDIPIYIQANWRSQDENVLGSAGPAFHYSNFENTPHKNRYYPVAIAEKITKTEITGPSDPDIVADFNKDINWYFGTDGNTPDSLYDFVSVVLHEIAHGLGFTGFFYVENDLGAYAYYDYGDATAFDLLVIDNDNNQLVDTTVFPVPSSELDKALTSSNLYANSAVAVAQGNGSNPKLYAPLSFNEGSSIYHLDNTFHPNNLMSHVIAKAEAVHDPEPLVTGILYDIGWKHMYLNFSEPKDREKPEPVTFNVSIESDYELDSGAIYIYFSKDHFETHKDSLALEPGDSLTIFTTVITPDFGTGEYDYYISAVDTMKRIFTLPTEAPGEIYNIKFGPDHETPEIEHTPIPYFLITRENPEIIAFADDNVGIDTVYVEYEINGVPQIPFGLLSDSIYRYRGRFNFNQEELHDGDEITYNIIARDISSAQNVMKIPLNDEFSFKAEEIFEPVTRYYNDFNSNSADFVLTDFEIYMEEDFENGALHSPHPYSSPEKINTYLNFTTVLKYPVILSENAKMVFDEIVLVEPGENQSEYGDDDFWDYVIVEGSSDSGKSWLPVIAGYDSNISSFWYQKYFENMDGSESITKGNSEWYESHSIDLLENGNFLSGDTILIRFRLFSDPFANGWGWVLDNLRIQIPVSSPILNEHPLEIDVHPNPITDIVNIAIKSNREINVLAIKIYNILGQQIILTQFENVPVKFSKEIDLRNLDKGIYLLSVWENGLQIHSQKILKN